MWMRINVWMDHAAKPRNAFTNHLNTPERMLTPFSDGDRVRPKVLLTVPNSSGPSIYWAEDCLITHSAKGFSSAAPERNRLMFSTAPFR